MTRIERFHSRSLEAVSNCLVRMLMVPDIYVDARWASRIEVVDLIAIDRAGRGDVHIVQVKESADAAIDAVLEIASIPAHYRWFAYPHDTPVPARRLHELTLSTGQGRVGLIEVFVMADGRLGARPTAPAERVFVSLYDEVRLLETSRTPDLSFREEVG